MKKILLGVGVALWLGGAALADTPAPEDPALSKLQQMVENLGYATKLSSDNQTFSTQWQAVYDYTMIFNISKGVTLGYVYVKMGSFNPDQLAKLDYAKLLEADDVGDFYFSMERQADGKSEKLYANVVLGLGGLSPADLRSLLQAMANRLDKTSAVWDPSTWK